MDLPRFIDDELVHHVLQDESTLPTRRACVKEIEMDTTETKYPIGPIKVTIEFKGHRVERTFQKAEVVQEAGVLFTYHENAVTPADISHNGHERMTLRAWNGFGQWEDFTPSSEVVKLDMGKGD